MSSIENDKSLSGFIRDSLERLKKSKQELDIEISTETLELRRLQSSIGNPATSLGLRLIGSVAIACLMSLAFYFLERNIEPEALIGAAVAGSIGIFVTLQFLASNSLRWRDELQRSVHRLELRRAFIEGEISAFESLLA